MPERKPIKWWGEFLMAGEVSGRPLEEPVAIDVKVTVGDLEVTHHFDVHSVRVFPLVGLVNLETGIQLDGRQGKVDLWLPNAELGKLGRRLLKGA